MTGNLSEADRFLLDQIRQGSTQGWSQLVERYQGRLLAFARRKLGTCPDIEDLVQETFISFLGGLPRFREEAGIETYLFLILRRKIASWMRGRRTNVGSLQDALGAADRDSEAGSPEPTGIEPTASWYARREEEHDSQRDALRSALREVVEHFRQRREFRELQIVEMIFYCQLRNSDIARLVQVQDNHVAVVKHRLIARLQAEIDERMRSVGSREDPSGQGQAFDLPDALLTQIWQEERPSCPKRSTIGAYLLDTLEADWRDYIRFHLQQLECPFCRANLDDIQSGLQQVPASTLRDRIMQSSIGFFANDARNS